MTKTPELILKEFNMTMDSFINAEETYKTILNPQKLEEMDVKVKMAKYAKTVLKNICEVK
jgi:hypothetical protein